MLYIGSHRRLRTVQYRTGQDRGSSRLQWDRIGFGSYAIAGSKRLRREAGKTVKLGLE